MALPGGGLSLELGCNGLRVQPEPWAIVCHHEQPAASVSGRPPANDRPLAAWGRGVSANGLNPSGGEVGEGKKENKLRDTLDITINKNK